MWASWRWARWCVIVVAWLGCGRAHPLPPYPPDATLDASRDATLDASRDAQSIDARSDDDGSVDEQPPPPPARAPRNLIIFMGDGMGTEQLATGRFAAGGHLRIDAMRGPAMVNTDSLTTMRVGGDDPPATDSAAAATALATGVLVENGVVSQTPDGMPLTTVLEAYAAEGKATALVTTAGFFDASPAAFGSHDAARGHYREIARQILGVTHPEVVMGAGAWLFDSPADDLPVLANDNGYVVLRNAAELAAWSPRADQRVLGIFETDFRPVAMASEPFTMTPQLERTPQSPDPALATMTARALERLALDPDGFFLFAEDEIFDEMGHRGPAEVEWANRAYPEQVAGLDAAVAVAIDWVLSHSSFDETLIVVLADHETGGYHFDHAIGPSSGTFSAYTDRGAFRAGYHTRTPIALYALGPGSEHVDHVASHLDAHKLFLGLLP